MLPQRTRSGHRRAQNRRSFARFRQRSRLYYQTNIDIFFPATAHKDLIMNKKYIRGLETELDDPTSAVNKKSLQRKIDILKPDFASLNSQVKKDLSDAVQRTETELRNDLATKAAVTSVKSELRQELASKAFVAASNGELRKDIHKQFLRPVHLTLLENKLDAKISALPQSGGSSGGPAGYTKSDVDAKFDELPGKVDTET